MLDALNGQQQMDTHFQSIKQIAVADLVLISKADLVNTAILDDLGSRINQLNPGVAVELVNQGSFDPSRILGAGFDAGGKRSADVDSWLSEAACEAVARARDAAAECRHHPSSGAHIHHHHDDAVQTFSVRHRGVVHPAGLKLWLDLLSVFQGPGLLRVKGIVNVEERPILVNFVQRACHPPLELDAWPSDDRSTRIVFITYGLEPEDLKTTLEALDFKPVRRQENKLIDPSDFNRFTGILARFRGSKTD
ncbi:MAG: hypothetical protein E4H01_07185 [Lysobacterales bacterium]|nr:MAG: hypothetical protein E4H01_07185 [Xanthomonadales bacterium]